MSKYKTINSSLNCVFVAGLLAGGIVSPAQAESSDAPAETRSGLMDVYYDFYLSGTVGAATTTADKSELNDRFTSQGFNADIYSVDGKRLGWSLGLGYDISDNWSLELSYYDLGEIDMVFWSAPVASSLANIHPESGDGWSLSGKYRHSLTEKLDLTGRLGLLDWKGDYGTSMLSNGQQIGTDSDSGTDLFYGLGLDYRVNSQWRLTSQLQRFEFDRDATHYFAVGFEYRWDRHTAKPVSLSQSEPVSQPPAENVAAPVAVVAEPAVVAVPVVSDGDQDGVNDNDDRCPQSVAGTEVDINGCAVDSDGDGVADHLDQCADTVSGKEVNEVGCVRFETQTLTFELNVKFNTGSSDIDQSYTQPLEEMALLLTQHPEVKAVIEGHTDNQGPSAYNLRLSEQRAQAVVDYLVTKLEISADRLTAEGLGESQPIADNASADGRQNNRRVIAVISVKEQVEKTMN